MSRISEIKKEIAEYEELINADVPQDEKDFAKSEIEDLKKELAKLEAKETPSEPKKKVEPKAPKPKAEPKAPKSKAEPKTKAEPKSKAKDDYDCDDLIKKEKERKAKAKANAVKRKNAPKKSPSTKNKEAVEKTATRVTKNVETRAKKGDVKVAELEKLIAEYEEAIKKLKALLVKVKSGKKFARGGNMGVMDSEHAREYHEIKEHSCGCGKKKMAKGGNIEAIKEYVIENKLSKGDLMKMAYGTEYKNVDSALPMGLLEEMGIPNSERYHYVMDYNKNSFGELVDLFDKIEEKNLFRTKWGIWVKDGEGWGPDGDSLLLEFSSEKEANDHYENDLDEEEKKISYVKKYISEPKVMANGKYARGGGVRARKRVEIDNRYSALKSGKRISEKYAYVDIRGGGTYKRRNANQYGKVKGGKVYYEHHENRVDGGRFLAKGGYADNFGEGAGARTLDELSVRELEGQLLVTKPTEKERIRYIKKLISKKNK